MITHDEIPVFVLRNDGPADEEFYCWLFCMAENPEFDFVDLADMNYGDNELSRRCLQYMKVADTSPFCAGIEPDGISEFIAWNDGDFKQMTPEEIQEWKERRMAGERMSAFVTGCDCARVI